MNINFSELKKGFLSYLDEKYDIDQKYNEADFNLFDFQDDFEDYVGDTLETDSDSEISIDQFGNVKIEDGKFQTEDKDSTKDADFYAEMLNEFFDQDNIKEYADTDSDGYLSEKEINMFLASANKYDDDENMFSFKDLFSSFKDVKDKTFDLSSLEDSSSDSLEWITKTNSSTLESDSLSSFQGGIGGHHSNSSSNSFGGNPYSSSSLGSSSLKAPENPLQGMSIEQLQSEKTTREQAAASSKTRMRELVSGSDKQIAQKKESMQTARSNYEQSLNNEESISDELKRQSLENYDAIMSKNDEINNTKLAISDNKIAISQQETLITSLDTQLGALRTSKGQLEAQIAVANAQGAGDSKSNKMQVDVGALQAQLDGIISQISQKQSELTTAQEVKAQKEAELAENESKLSEQNNQLKEFEAQKTEINKQISGNESDKNQLSDDFMTASKNLQDSIADYKDYADESISNAQTAIDNAYKAIDEVTAKIDEVQAKKLISETAPPNELFSDISSKENFAKNAKFVTGGKLDYVLVPPADYDPNKEYPLLVALHGAGEQNEYSDGNVRMTQAFASSELNAFNGFIMIPISKASGWPCDYTTKKVMSVLEDVENEYNIDSNKIGLMGFSLGAEGVLYMANKYKDKFCGVATLSQCGKSNSFDMYEDLVEKGVRVKGYAAQKDPGLNFMKKNYKSEDLVELDSKGHCSVPEATIKLDEDGDGCADVLKFIFEDEDK